MKPVLILFVVLLATTSVSSQSAAYKRTAETEIRKVMNDQAAAWNRGDIEGFMRGYWNSPELVFLSGTNVTRGWQPTLDRYKKRYNSREKMGTLTFSDLEVTVLSRDAAVVLGSWALKTNDGDPHGKFTLIFRRLRQGWRIVMDHTS